MSKMYLVHYGIKGQKWGVRRYQNYDGSLTTLGKVKYRVPKSTEYDANIDYSIAKGTRYERLTSNPNEKFSNRIYVSGNANDYLEIADQLGIDTTVSAYAIGYGTTRNAVMAGKKTVISILNEMNTEESKAIIKAIESSIGNDDDDVYKKRDFLYKSNTETAKEFISKLRSRGYDGIADPVDTGLNNKHKHYYDREAMIFVNDVLKKYWTDDRTYKVNEPSVIEISQKEYNKLLKKGKIKYNVSYKIKD